MNYFILDAGEMTELLVAYFIKFGDKPCCGGDLKLYLPILDASEADKFFVQTLNSINFDETKDDDSDFEFNQDFEADGENRSPGWIRYQKRIK